MACQTDITLCGTGKGRLECFRTFGALQNQEICHWGLQHELPQLHCVVNGVPSTERTQSCA